MKEHILCHLVAASENNVIGINDDLPWKLSGDMVYFKNKTWGMPIIMGRNSFDGLKNELPGRVLIVLTHQQGWTAPNVQTAHSPEEAIELAKDADTREIFITGGGIVFAATLPLIDRIYITRVHATIEGDTYYPEFSKDEWELVSTKEHGADEKYDYSYTFEVWERK